jgi:hypothetical protein
MKPKAITQPLAGSQLLHPRTRDLSSLKDASIISRIPTFPLHSSSSLASNINHLRSTLFKSARDTLIQPSPNLDRAGFQISTLWTAKRGKLRSTLKFSYLTNAFCSTSQFTQVAIFRAAHCREGHAHLNPTKPSMVIPTVNLKILKRYIIEDSLTIPQWRGHDIGAKQGF